ncbi:MAG: cytidine deaminase [Bacteriovoracaceae bacterium]|nr:cytidine deaminase [Bacteriovoracaceae bacterium]
MILSSQTFYNNDVMKAYDLAVVGFHRAYAPYSKFRVGAAVKIKNSTEIIFGCNVENISLGATICAERNAINQALVRINVDTKAVPSGSLYDSKMKPIEIEFVVVVADTETPTMPCGMCLQCLNEFSTGKTNIIVANLEKIFGTVTLEQLLPAPYINI